jgi:glycosyltransferase involved in cell wall biosynthesis
MRILVISPTPTHPQDAGNRARIHALLAALKAAGHQVHLLLLMRENPSPAALAAMRAAWDEVVEVPHDRRAERRSLGPLNAVDDWITPEAEAAFAAQAARRPGFDIVLAQYVFLSRALEFFPDGTVKAIDAHDLFAGRAERLAALGLANTFFATTEAEEARGLDRADLVLAIQAEEGAALRGRTRARVITLGHLPADSRPPPPPRTADGWVTIGYLGSVNPLNTRSVARFLEAVDPPALARLGGEVVVAGGAGRELRPGGGLRVMGPVEDADALYAAVDLVVNPQEGGTGLKIKTVEALARGRPVIGTAEAFAGLPAAAVFHAARDAAEVAMLARRFVAEPGFRAEVAAESRRLFRSYAAEVEGARAAFASPRALPLLRQPPRLLLVTDIPFWRGTLGNHARIAALAGAASAEMDVDLFFCGGMTEEERAAATRLLGARGRVFAAEPRPAAEKPWGLTPFERARFDGAIFAALEAHLAAHPPQAVIIEYLRLSYLRLAQPMPALTVLDTHDVMSLRAQNFRRFGVEHFIQIPTSEELRILASFALVLAIQAEEARWLEALLPGQVLLAPHAMPALPQARGSAGGAVRVGFLGGDSPMNRDGLRWLLDQVWPAVDGTGAELHVAGGVCALLAELTERRGVVAHGEVADAQAFLDGIDIAVNPVAYGGGLKIKTVEYLCRGLPGVLTAEALYGIAGGAGSAYALAADRARFVAALDALIRDPAARARIGEAAFAFGRRHFGPRALEAPMRSIAALARGVPEPWQLAAARMVGASRPLR